MTAESMIVRRPLRDDVREAILARIVKGLHPAGQRIHEGQLAQELGVSRTPVREALMHLQQMGVLEVRPNSGFYVVPITATDIREVYPMIGALERLAVRSTEAGGFDDVLEDLLSLTDELDRATTQPKRAEELDHQWHTLLISRCGNDRLISTVAELKRLVNRYETGFMSDPESVEVSAKQHRSVVEALQAGATKHAEELIQANWETGMVRLLAWHEAGSASGA
jgi:DNA-binding GntR family transcriptional regulator